MPAGFTAHPATLTRYEDMNSEWIQTHSKYISICEKLNIKRKHKTNANKHTTADKLPGKLNTAVLETVCEDWAWNLALLCSSMAFSVRVSTVILYSTSIL